MMKEFSNGSYRMGIKNGSAVLNDKVRVISDNDGYNDFKDKLLTITHRASSVKEHQGYDESMKGQFLFDFKDEDGNDIPCSLYSYEVEPV